MLLCFSFHERPPEASNAALVLGPGPDRFESTTYYALQNAISFPVGAISRASRATLSTRASLANCAPGAQQSLFSLSLFLPFSSSTSSQALSDTEAATFQRSFKQSRSAKENACYVSDARWIGGWSRKGGQHRIFCRIACEQIKSLPCYYYGRREKMAVVDERHILLHRIDASICVYSNGWCAVGISLHFISLRQVRAFKEAFITYNVCSSSLMLLWWKRCAASLRNLLARNASFHEDVVRYSQS